jgi:hypothetical protein
MKNRTLSAALSFAICAVGGAGMAGAQTLPGGAKPFAYRVVADVVADRVCIPRLTFNPGDTIVWRAEIAGPTGVRVNAAQIKAVGLQAVVTLKDGTKVPLAFGVHPPFPNAPATDTYWSGAYFVKGDHPTGTLPWTLTVTDNAGNTVPFVPIGQANGVTVLTIAEKAAAAPKT